jgi:hypothetical protein
MATDKVAVGIRLTPALKEAAMAAAARDRRSFSIWVEMAIEAALAKDEQKSEGAPVRLAARRGD